MTLRTQILVALILVGTIPGLAALFSYEGSRRSLTETLGQLQKRTAKELARVADTLVLEALQDARVSVSYLPLSEATSGEAPILLRIPFSQDPSLRILALFNPDGTLVAPPVRRRPSDDGFVSSDREIVSDEALVEFADSLPSLAEVQEVGFAVGAPYVSAIDGTVHFSIAVQLPRPSRRVVAAEVSLQPLAEHFASLARPGEVFGLLGPDGNSILSNRAEVLGNGSVLRPMLTETSDSPHLGVLALQGGTPWLAAITLVPSTHWHVAVLQPEAQAFQSAVQARQTTFTWLALALVVAGLLGLGFARGLSRPVARLSETVLAFGRGDLTLRSSEVGNNEVGKLAASFNAMANDIAAKNEELTQWNRNLQARIDQKTLELEKAQDQILRSQKLSAIASMTAGFSHELNNPLMGLMGLSSHLRPMVQDVGDASELLDMMDEQLDRISRLAASFSRLTESQLPPSHRTVSLQDTLQLVLDEKAAYMRRKDIKHSLLGPHELPLVSADHRSLRQVLDAPLCNALESMDKGGFLEIKLSNFRGEACGVAIRDTGNGIPKEFLSRIFDPFFTTKAAERHAGLGLTLAHRALEDLGGKVEVSSKYGEGTVVNLILPAAPKQAHLQ